MARGSLSAGPGIWVVGEMKPADSWLGALPRGRISSWTRSRRARRQMTLVPQRNRDVCRLGLACDVARRRAATGPGSVHAEDVRRRRAGGELGGARCAHAPHVAWVAGQRGTGGVRLVLAAAADRQLDDGGRERAEDEHDQGGQRVRAVVVPAAEREEPGELGEDRGFHVGACSTEPLEVLKSSMANEPSRASAERPVRTREIRVSRPIRRPNLTPTVDLRHFWTGNALRCGVTL